MGFLSKLTTDESRKLDSVLFSGLAKTTDDGVWDDTAEIITDDIRGEETRKTQGR